MTSFDLHLDPLNLELRTYNGRTSSKAGITAPSKKSWKVRDSHRLLGKLRRKKNRNGNGRVGTRDESDGIMKYGRSFSSIICRAFAILLVAGLCIFVVLTRPSLSNHSPLLVQTIDNLQEISLSPEESRVIKLPTEVLTEVLDICLYFSWRMEHPDATLLDEPFEEAEYKSTLPIPSFLVHQDRKHIDREISKTKEEAATTETTTIEEMTKSSSTALLRYVAMRGELYPLTSVTHEREIDNEVSEDSNSVRIENLDERILQGLYVDELLEKMKQLELYLFQQLDVIKLASSGGPSGYVRGAAKDDDLQELVRIAVREFKIFFEFAELLLDGHIDPFYDNDRDFTVADILMYSLANRLFVIDGKGVNRSHKLVPELKGAMDLDDYPSIENSVRLVSEDHVISTYFVRRQ